MEFTAREQIIEVINKLFNYTDYQEWDKLQTEVFEKNVFLDMTSLGGEASEVTAIDICKAWEDGFKELDAVNHLAGNHVVTIQGNSADVFGYATATHYKASAKKGNTREFVGSYDLHLKHTTKGWRIDKLKYNLKYTSGNMMLE